MGLGSLVILRGPRGWQRWSPIQQLISNRLTCRALLFMRVSKFFRREVHVLFSPPFCVQSYITTFVHSFSNTRILFLSSRWITLQSVHSNKFMCKYIYMCVWCYKLRLRAQWYYIYYLTSDGVTNPNEEYLCIRIKNLVWLQLIVILKVRGNYQRLETWRDQVNHLYFCCACGVTVEWLTGVKHYTTYIPQALSNRG